jgi:hypothetical protein
MSDLSAAIKPKADQLTADDLIPGPITIQITRVDVTTGDQPVSVHFENDHGKPWRPCKTMARVLANLWGPDSSTFTGRAVTLYRDPKVKFGGLEVGGIRISHMSHIDGPQTMALTVTRGSKKAHSVKPLGKPAQAPQRAAAPAQQQAAPAPAKAAPGPDKAAIGTEGLIKRYEAAASLAELHAMTRDEAIKNQRAWLFQHRPELDAKLKAAYLAAQERLSVPPPVEEEDDFPGVVTREDPDPFAVDATVAGYGQDTRMAG